MGEDIVCRIELIGLVITKVDEWLIGLKTEGVLWEGSRSRRLCLGGLGPLKAAPRTRLSERP